MPRWPAPSLPPACGRANACWGTGGAGGGGPRLGRRGAPQQPDLRLQDYRDVADGPFDAIVSIEMFEAVGREYWEAYFQTLRRQLKPGGRACVQAIVIR